MKLREMKQNTLYKFTNKDNSIIVKDYEISVGQNQIIVIAESNEGKAIINFNIDITNDEVFKTLDYLDADIGQDLLEYTEQEILEFAIELCSQDLALVNQRLSKEKATAEFIQY